MNGESFQFRKRRERKAFLALADGTVFRGWSCGFAADACGEVVFNTGMSGYQEILTDPSYAGQFVAFTCPEIGNYGVNSEDVESRALFLNGVVLRELNEASNFRSEESFAEYLARNQKPGIAGVDTRALTLHLRDHGNQKAYLHVEELEMSEADAVALANAWEGLDGQDYAAKVTCAEKWSYNSDSPSATGGAADCGREQGASGGAADCGREQGASGGAAAVRARVAVYDFGVKANILRSLAAQGFDLTILPAQTPAEEILAMKPDGVFLSNGPADPAAVTYAVENIRKLLAAKIPMMGICLGHQLLAIACGAKTGRLTFGHHGCNHPVKNLVTGGVEITSQNHNFAVLPESVPDTLEVTHINLNDNTIEGIRHKTLPAFSVQYHPEACPGPKDSQYLFEQFRRLIYDL